MEIIDQADHYLSFGLQSHFFATFMVFKILLSFKNNLPQFFCKICIEAIMALV